MSRDPSKPQESRIGVTPRGGLYRQPVDQAIKQRVDDMVEQIKHNLGLSDRIPNIKIPPSLRNVIGDSQFPPSEITENDNVQEVQS